MNLTTCTLVEKREPTVLSSTLKLTANGGTGAVRLSMPTCAKPPCSTTEKARAKAKEKERAKAKAKEKAADLVKNVTVEARKEVKAEAEVKREAEAKAEVEVVPVKNAKVSLYRHY